MPFVTSYIDYARSNAPESFAELAAVTCCCAALGDRVYVNTVWGRVFPSIYVCFVGSSKITKSSAVNRAADLLIEANGDVQLPQSFSVEALLLHLAEHPTGTIFWSEMGIALSALTRDYNAGGMSLLIDLWDNKRSTTRLTMKHGPVEIKYPAVTILAAGKPAFFRRFFQPDAVGDGYLSRWLHLYEKEPSSYVSPFGLNHDRSAEMQQRESLIEHLQALFAFEGAELLPGEAKPILDRWEEKLRDEWDEDADPAEFHTRAAANVMKLAMGLMASKDVTHSLALGELDPEAVKTAIGLWERCFASGRELVEGIKAKPSRDSDDLDRVSDAIRKGQGQWVSQRDVLRATKMRVDTVKALAFTLQQAGAIEWRDEPNARGTETRWYRWIG